MTQKEATGSTNRQNEKKRSIMDLPPKIRGSILHEQTSETKELMEWMEKTTPDNNTTWEPPITSRIKARNTIEETKRIDNAEEGALEGVSVGGFEGIVEGTKGGIVDGLLEGQPEGPIEGDLGGIVDGTKDGTIDGILEEQPAV